MFDTVQAALSSSLFQAGDGLPADLQYMPPGRHRINATRGGKPVTLEVTVDAAAAGILNGFLQEQLTKAQDGSEDRPYFDFNHEDREAAAWPTEFYWAGEDPVSGGVRAKLEWTGAGKAAIEQKTFRRFSPTFLVDANGRVAGSTTNMGGLVNRAAFKTIQPLFAKQTGRPMNQLLEALRELQLIEATTLPEAELVASVKARLGQRDAESRELKSRVEALEAEKAEAVKARANRILDDAVKAGRIAPRDEESRAFWLDAVLRDESKAVKALESLPRHPVLEQVTSGGDPKQGLASKMEMQQRKLAEIRAAHPQADFQTIFSKAQADAPDLFR